MERLRAPLPAHAGARASSRSAATGSRVPRRAHRRAAPTTRSPSTSSPTCAGRPATDAESALLQAALRRLLRGPRRRRAGRGRADEAPPPRDHRVRPVRRAPSTVDFDQLSDAGLFLLTGPTGAGKTSVLDAVCFALYGDVPGDRSAAKRLRSDQAAPGVAPRVALEATLSGRRFRHRPLAGVGAAQEARHRHHHRAGLGARSPSASTATGSPTPPGSTRPATWSPACSGMNVAQFTQVAMLPQGRFQAFLRARSEERHRLLQQLFRTGRFEDVERWLRDRRLDAAARCRRPPTGASPTWSAGSARPPGAAAPARDRRPTAWARAHARRRGRHPRRDRHRGDARRPPTRPTPAERASRPPASRSTSAQRPRLAAASRRARAALLAAAPQHAEAARDRLDAARRAAGVVPLHRVAVRARRARVGRRRPRSQRLDVTDRDRRSSAALAEAVDGAAAGPRPASRAADRGSRARPPRGRAARASRAAELGPAPPSAPASRPGASCVATLDRRGSPRPSEAHARRPRGRTLRPRAEPGRALDAARAAAQRDGRRDRRRRWSSAAAARSAAPATTRTRRPRRPGAPDDAAEKAARRRTADDAAATEHACATSRSATAVARELAAAHRARVDAGAARDRAPRPRAGRGLARPRLRRRGGRASPSRARRLRRRPLLAAVRPSSEQHAPAPRSPPSTP